MDVSLNRGTPNHPSYWDLPIPSLPLSVAPSRAAALPRPLRKPSHTVLGNIFKYIVCVV